MKIIVKLIIFMIFSVITKYVYGVHGVGCAAYNLTLANDLFITLWIECAIGLICGVQLSIVSTLWQCCDAIRCDWVWACLIFNLRYNLTTFMEIQYFRIFQHPFNLTRAILHQRSWLKLAMKSHLVAPWSYLFVHAVLQQWAFASCAHKSRTLHTNFWLCNFHFFEIY